MHIKSIEFPRDEGQRYYKTHFQFFRHLALAAGIKVKEVHMPIPSRGFEVRANGQRILIDFGDHFMGATDLDKFDLCFRYHYSEIRHTAEPHTFPLTPISFYGWGEYYKLASTLTYTADSDWVLNNQKPGAAAMERRKKVQKILRKNYDEKLDLSRTNPQIFWQKVENCLVSVCVPGARNDILDRGQLQYWGFGACTISPVLNISLPWNRRPQPGAHYVQCAADYSNLIEKIEWCRANRDECRRIGANAKELFSVCCTPTAIWSWLEFCTAKGRES